MPTEFNCGGTLVCGTCEEVTVWQRDFADLIKGMDFDRDRNLDSQGEPI